jgi:hypothetical protein
MMQIWYEFHSPQEENAAEIALVFDPESALYVDQSDPRADEFACHLRSRLGCLGAPYRAFSFSDIETLDLAPYRLLIMPNMYVLDERRRCLLRERVLRDDRTVLWLDRPGVIADGRYDLSGVERLTGIPSGQGRTISRRLQGWTSVLAPLPAPDSTELRRVAAAAGVHIYSTSGEPVTASRRLIMLHTATGGRRRLHLVEPCDRVVELFSGRTLSGRTGGLEDSLEAPCTALYHLRHT